MKDRMITVEFELCPPDRCYVGSEALKKTQDTRSYLTLLTISQSELASKICDLGIFTCKMVLFLF